MNRREKINDLICDLSYYHEFKLEGLAYLTDTEIDNLWELSNAKNEEVVKEQQEYCKRKGAVNLVMG